MNDGWHCTVGARPNSVMPAARRGIGVLDVDLVERFDVFAHERDRHDADRARAICRELRDQQFGRRLEPFFRAEPALER